MPVHESLIVTTERFTIDPAHAPENKGADATEAGPTTKRCFGSRSDFILLKQNKNA
jgi:hypothetical protein